MPWYQYAVIVYLAKKMQEQRQRFGKTALQKLVYLLETVFTVPVGYQYSLYIHGPYCRELMDDLDYIDCIGGVNVTADPSINGYNISPGQQAGVIEGKAQEFLDKYQSQIDQLMAEFGSMRVRDLELRSTIIFVDCDALASHREMKRSDFVREINSIKPHFKWEEIEEAMAELESRKYIKRRQ